ncbi:hypothetical protein [Brasilonema sennae]|nr:hypothetical protein [Brasilonema sennae]
MADATPYGYREAALRASTSRGTRTPDTSRRLRKRKRTPRA